MAHFRGTVRGARGEASRLGGKSSGLIVVANSWEGRVTTELYYSEAEQCDWARVVLSPRSGSGGTIIYQGPVSYMGRQRATL